MIKIRMSGLNLKKSYYKRTTYFCCALFFKFNISLIFIDLKFKLILGKNSFKIWIFFKNFFLSW